MGKEAKGETDIGEHNQLGSRSLFASLEATGSHSSLQVIGRRDRAKGEIRTRAIKSKWHREGTNP